MADVVRWQLELGGEVIARIDANGSDFPFTCGGLVDSPAFERFRRYFTDPDDWPKDDPDLEGVCGEVQGRGRFVLRDMTTGVAYEGVCLNHDGLDGVWFRHGDPAVNPLPGVKPMTEGDWITATDPQAMLAFLTGRGTLPERKLRLFAVACCRRVWHLLIDGPSHKAVEVTERFADGAAKEEELDAARGDAAEFANNTVHEDEAFIGLADDALNAADVPAWAARWEVEVIRVVVATQRALGTPENKGIADLIRDIIGNPFRPNPPLSPSVLAWEGGLVVKRAEAAYENRLLPSGLLAPNRLTVLGDALEDAGCADAQLLAHLRSQGPHVRGCFAIELLTGRGG